MTSKTKAAFLFCLIFSSLHYNVSAQVQIIGERDLSKLELLKGEISIQLHDTVSPEFIQQSFAEANLHLKSLHILPVQATLKNVSESDLKTLKRSPLVLNVKELELPVREAIRNLEFSDGMSNEEKEKRRNQLLNSNRSFYMVEFQYHILEKEVSSFFSQEFDEIIVQSIRSTPKFVVLITPQEKEQEYMGLAERLPFVENTARIAKNTDFQ